MPEGIHSDVGIRNGRFLIPDAPMKPSCFVEGMTPAVKETVQAAPALMFSPSRASIGVSRASLVYPEPATIPEPSRSPVGSSSAAGAPDLSASFGAVGGFGSSRASLAYPDLSQTAPDPRSAATSGGYSGVAPTGAGQQTAPVGGSYGMPAVQGFGSPSLFGGPSRASLPAPLTDPTTGYPLSSIPPAGITPGRSAPPVAFAVHHEPALAPAPVPAPVPAPAPAPWQPEPVVAAPVVHPTSAPVNAGWSTGTDPATGLT